MRHYSILDLMRFHKFALEKENEKFTTMELLILYNKKYPELSAEERMENLNKNLDNLIKELNTSTNLT